MTYKINLITYLRFGVLWIINFWFIIPIFRFLSLWILNFLWWQEIPVCFKLTTLNLGPIDAYLIGVIGLHNECVEMCEFIILRKNVAVSVRIRVLHEA